MLQRDDDSLLSIFHCNFIFCFSLSVPKIEVERRLNRGRRLSQRAKEEDSRTSSMMVGRNHPLDRRSHNDMGERRSSELGFDTEKEGIIG